MFFCGRLDLFSFWFGGVDGVKVQGSVLVDDQGAGGDGVRVEGSGDRVGMGSVE